MLSTVSLLLICVHPVVVSKFNVAIIPSNPRIFPHAVISLEEPQEYMHSDPPPLPFTSFT